jgi:hypothetical protein
MQNKKVILLCENHHFDPLMLLAQQKIYHSLNKNIYKHALIERDGPVYTEIDDDCSDIGSIDHYMHSPFFSSCFSDETEDLYCLDYNLKREIQSQYTPHYIDYNQRTDFLFSLNLCPQLEMLENIRIESVFAGTLYTMIKSLHETDVNKERDEAIVNTIKNTIEDIENEKAIGSIGQAHCVDLYYNLKSTDSSLLNKIIFLNLHSDYFFDDNNTKIALDALRIYHFKKCLEKFDASNLFNRISRVGPYLEGIDQEEDDQEKLRDAEFLSPPNVIDINISMSGEDGTMKPWDVAGLDVF